MMGRLPNGRPNGLFSEWRWPSLQPIPNEQARENLVSLSVHAQEAIQRTAQAAGYSGAGVFTGMTLADIDVVIRIVVGTLTAISICVHIWLKLRAERKKP